MKFDIKALKKAGYIVTKEETHKDIIRKADGKPFKIWIGGIDKAHVVINDVKEIERDYKIIESISYTTKDEAFGMIFDTTEITTWGTTEGISFI